MPKRDFDQSAAQLARAMELGTAALRQHQPPDMTRAEVDQMVAQHDTWQSHFLAKDTAFRSLQSLDMVTQGFMTYFHEAQNAAVEQFWRAVADEGLPFVRVDRLGKILARKAIRGRGEYDFAVDSLIIAQQDGRIDAAQAAVLSACIAAYEARHMHKPR